ncbi:hypothetical protein E5N98_24940 (plasmid) [Salmonella enterica subsp. enterica serovar Typhimurium]|nr:hypothetical protein E5N98_24940 [Salmonella enterica subsp. enterica serovar Typhimurium]QCG17941.1 hypothetical protein E5N99_24705 [Salmonella enterica subsp. enterica serovar 1,4,[5],12:i:-]QCW44755.1 hypothetical protein FGO77_24585 [Salmonella enterica subsp. enterica serovar 1,4,[5],12:i:-]
MGSCAAPSAKGDDKFITTDYLQQCLMPRRSSEHSRPDMTTSLTTAYISCSEHITIYGGKTTGSQGSGSNRNAILKSLWIRDMLPVWAALITAYISCSEQNTHQRQ